MSRADTICSFRRQAIRVDEVDCDIPMRPHAGSSGRQNFRPSRRRLPRSPTAMSLADFHHQQFLSALSTVTVVPGGNPILTGDWAAALLGDGQGEALILVEGRYRQVWQRRMQPSPGIRPPYQGSDHLCDPARRQEGRITLDKLLTVSHNAAAQSPVKMGFSAGTTVTVDNALKMLMVKSAMTSRW